MISGAGDEQPNEFDREDEWWEERKYIDKPRIVWVYKCMWFIF